MTTPTATISVRKILPCPPATAFRAWTTPEIFQEWFACAPGMKAVAQMDVRVGGKYRITFHRPAGKPTRHVGGEFLRVEVPTRLEYTWVYENDGTEDPWTDQSIVSIIFNDLGDGRTEVVLTHDLISDSEDRTSHAKGWTMILDYMAEGLAAK